MFTERKIEKFQQTISGLPDTPNLSAAELKRRFDACPEELRAALNGVCDDGAALEKRMDAYRAETFEGEITRDMLAPAVQSEISGKAEQTALDTKADQTELNAANAAISQMQTQITAKCSLICGEYTGDGTESKTIELGVQPKAVFVYPTESAYVDRDGGEFHSGLAFPGYPVTCPYGTDTPYMVLEVTATGFKVYYREWDDIDLNSNAKFRYLAFV
ncbi:MAG: hypothetical protein KH319_06685 [Butyricicoccus pullicaecorum]|nr:hypothetical protein [Butyricicoccus pullicaecorum]